MKPRTLVFLGAFFASGLNAQPSLTHQQNIIQYTQSSHPDWQAFKLYRQGEIVFHQGETYIAFRPVIGIAPKPNDKRLDGWIWAQKSTITKWEDEAYPGGELVKHGPYFYMSRHRTEHTPGQSRHWLKINDLFYPIPDIPEQSPEDFATLNGQDLNENGIRDDYERAIYTRYSEPELIEYAMKLAPALQKVIEIYQKGAEHYSADENSDAIERLVNGRKCTRILKRQYPNFKSPQVNYYNSFDRAVTKRLSMVRIYRHLEMLRYERKGRSMDCDIDLLEAEL